MRFLSVVPLLALWLLSVPAIAQSRDAPSASEQRILRLELEKASDALKKKDYQEARAYADAAAKLAPGTAPILNFYGAIATEEGDYDVARNYFLQALRLHPNYFPAEYNLIETTFMEGDYSRAASEFIDLLVKYPDNELIEYKIFLSFLLLDRPSDAERWLGRIRYPGNTPAWFYAQAAKELHAGNDPQAKKLIKSARSIYGDQTELYDQSLQDVGLRPW